MIINKNDYYFNFLYKRLYEFHLFLPTSGRSVIFAGARDFTRQLVYMLEQKR
jgi:hypothetical protein